MNAIVPRGKLAHILGMLGSSFDGEVLAAARLAERIRRETGLTWPEILQPNDRPASRPAPEPPRPYWRELLEQCQRREDELTPWERRFTASIARRAFLSRRQREVLEGIAEKVAGI